MGAWLDWAGAAGAESTKAGLPGEDALPSTLAKPLEKGTPYIERVVCETRMCQNFAALSEKTCVATGNGDLKAARLPTSRASDGPGVIRVMRTMEFKMTRRFEISLQLQLIRIQLAYLLPVVAAVGALACAPASTPHEIIPLAEPQGPDSTVAALEGPGEFDGSRAWRDVEVLLAEESRAAGSEGARSARAYLAEELERAGLRTENIVHTAALASGADVEPHAPSLLTSLLATTETNAEGSPELMLFVAPYTTRRATIGAEDSGSGEAGGSGAAVLLEIARALASRPDAAEGYAQVFLFVSGDGDPGDSIAGSRSIADLLGERNLLDRVRAGFFIDRVCDPDLRLVRDLYSSRNYREVVWRAARELGYSAVFADAGFAAPATGHRAFRDAGVHQMVGLVGSADGVGDSLETCSSASLGAVGAVVMRAGDIVEARLAQIDRFAAAPAAVTASDERERRAASWSQLEPPAAATEDRLDEAGVADGAAMSDKPAEPGAPQDRQSEDFPGRAVTGEE